MIYDRGDETGVLSSRAEHSVASRPLLVASPTSGERHTGTLTSSGSFSTGQGRLTGGAPRSATVPPHPTGAGQPRIRLALRACEEAVDRAVENSENPIDKANAVHDLRDGLARLWNERNGREPQFGDLVGHLQGLLIGVEPEEIPLRGAKGLAQVIHLAAGRDAFTDLDLAEFEAILIGADFNVYRTLH